jgi:transcriptional regulator with XRE-family HTH domain
MRKNSIEDIDEGSLTTFGARLQYCRTKAGLSQGDLATMFGVSKAAISGWERQGTQVRFEVLMPLARLFKVSVEWLIEGAGPVPDVQAVSHAEVALGRVDRRDHLSAGLSPLQAAVIDALARAFRKGAIPTKVCLELLTEWEQLAST